MENLPALILLIGVIVLPIILYRSYNHIGSSKGDKAGFAAFGTVVILLVIALILNKLKG